MANRNAWGKTRDVEQPYITIPRGDWEWRVLKAYKSAKSAAGDLFARYLCAVRSPYTFGEWEIGDTYIREIPAYRDILAQQARAEGV